MPTTPRVETEAAVDRPASPLRLPYFRWFWASQTLGTFGAQMSEVTLPSVAILALQASPTAVGFLKALQTLPYLVFGLVIGVVADRISRRWMILMSACGRALLLAGVPVAAALHVLTFPLLCLLAAVHGTLTVVFTVACQAYLPELIDRRALTQGNVQLQFSRSAVETTSPAVSGLMISWLGARNATAADAVSHLAAALAIMRVRPPLVPATPVTGKESEAGRNRQSFRAQIGEGMVLVFRDPIIRSVTFVNATLNFGYAMAQAMLLLFAYRELRLSPAAVGSLLALGSVGMVLGAVLAVPLSRRFGLRLVLGAACLIIGAGVLVLPLGELGMGGALVAVAQFLMSVGFPVYNANQVTLRQERTPIEMQARVAATARTLGIGVIPVGAVLAGALVSRLGFGSTIAVGGLIASISPVWLIGGRSRPGRHRAGRVRRGGV
jgi:MFS family permease